jgi:hypothetical protein
MAFIAQLEWLLSSVFFKRRAESCVAQAVHIFQIHSL